MRSPARSPRALCLWFPDWPIQRLVAARPELGRALLLLTESMQRGQFVRYGNPFSAQRGIQAGMPISEARSLARTRDVFVIDEVDPANDAQALRELAWRCERYSFRIGLEEADPPECILMDVTGIAHFFGGEQSLAEQLQQEMSTRRYDGRIAIAQTIGSAWAAAHFLAGAGKPRVVPNGQESLIESLPVEGLRLAAATLARLHRLGLRTIRQVLDLDRGALVRRLGKELLVRLDQMRGELAEFITPCQPVPKFQVERRLEEGVVHHETIEHLWSLLLRRLMEMLRPKRLGARHLRCRFFLENRTSQEVALRLCETTGDLGHVGDLLRLKLERLRLEAPLIGLDMEALEVAPLESSQQEFFDGGSRDRAHRFLALLNRLSSRLGEETVLYARLLPDPVLERSALFVPVTGDMSSGSTTIHQRLLPLDRPTALFPQPRRVEVLAVVPDGPPAALFWNGKRLDVARAWGPERIESGWWHGPSVRRDYYRLETTEGRRLWLFRRLPDRQWFWHGELM